MNNDSYYGPKQWKSTKPGRPRLSISISISVSMAISTWQYKFISLEKPTFTNSINSQKINEQTQQRCFQNLGANTQKPQNQNQPGHSSRLKQSLATKKSGETSNSSQKQTKQTRGLPFAVPQKLQALQAGSSSQGWSKVEFRNHLFHTHTCWPPLLTTSCVWTLNDFLGRAWLASPAHSCTT